MRNVYACLVHEDQGSVIDLVRNLSSLDPESQILLYNGGEDPDLLAIPFSSNGSAPLVHPNPRPLKWGALHPFALDCMRYAGETTAFDTLTIVDSDQLATRPRYSEYIGQYLEARPGVGMLGTTNRPERREAPRGCSVAAFQELDLWRPFLSRFERGEAKFPFWTYWPTTVFTAPAAQELVALTQSDDEFAQILAQTSIWAAEEVVLPTLVALLGYEIDINPCSHDFVHYRTAYSRGQVATALRRHNVFWIHPISRCYDDPLRAQIRAAHNEYGRSPLKTQAPENSPRANGEHPPLLLPSQILSTMRKIDGWLSDEEGELLIGAAIQALTTLPEPHTIVEIGSYCGRSTSVLASVVKAIEPGGRVHTIDPHDGQVGALDSGIQRLAPTLARFERNIASAGLTDQVITLVERSYETDWNRPISLLLVDGLHDYANVSRDFRHFERWLVDGGLIAFHDYAPYYPGVQAFVDELLSTSDYEDAHCAGSLMLLRRKQRRKRRLTKKAQPVVTCLMPTYDRPQLAQRAIAYFLRQDITNAELFVVDDGPEPIAHLVPDDDRVRYLRLDQRHTIGAKRNLAAELTAAPMLANWDDDDWYAPWRLSYQVQQLEASDAAVCGLRSLLYFEPRAQQAWRYTPPAGMRPWLADPTLLFTRRFWQENPFPDTSAGIDCRLLWGGAPKQLLALDRDEFFVGIIHAGNTSPKNTALAVWRPEPTETIHAIVGLDLARDATVTAA